MTSVCNKESAVVPFEFARDRKSQDGDSWQELTSLGQMVVVLQQLLVVYYPSHWNLFDAIILV